MAHRRPSQRWYPTQNDIADAQRTERSLNRILDLLYRQEDLGPLALKDLEGRIPAIIRANADAIRQQLQSPGAFPLNVTNLLGQLAQAQSAIQQDVYANRPAASGLQEGTLFSATDRGSIIFATRQVSGAMQWAYLAGMMAGTFANRPSDLGVNDVGFLYFANADTPAYNHVWRWTGTAWAITGVGLMRGTLSPDQKATGLGTADTGFVFYSTDFDRRYRWTGTVWEDYDSDARTIVMSDIALGTGYFVCNGTGVTISTSSGGTAAYTTPDYSTAAYLKLASASFLGPTAAGGLTAAVSGGTPAGTNSAPTFTGNTDNTSANSGSTTVMAGAGSSVASDGHNHSFTPGGSVSAPTFTGSALATHDHGPSTLELRRTQLLAYKRG